MTSFSERMGVKQPRELQIRSMDDGLRNRLWNLLSEFFWSKTSHGWLQSREASLWMSIWDAFLKRRVGEFVTDPKFVNHSVTITALREQYAKLAWNEVYDLVEFIVRSYNWYSPAQFEQFATKLNKILAEELAGFRLAKGLLIQITDPAELGEIKSAIESTNDPVAHQIRSAVTKLTDRTSPDYRNAIKDAIGAVETASKLAAGLTKGTLADALKALKRNWDIHPALIDGYDKLYGYTCDADGIRHGLMEDPNLDFASAKYMVVSCAAFANYLVAEKIEREKP